MKQSNRPATPQDLFTKIAPWYDIVNSIASCRRDRRWREFSLSGVSTKELVNVIDVACGTGAMATAINQLLPNARIIGVDLNSSMLDIAERRQGRRYERLIQGSADSLPCESNYFHIATMAFAFHDLTEPASALSEIFRVLLPGGQLVCLELSLPSNQRYRRRYVKFLRTLVAIRNWLGLASEGHVIDEILASPSQSYLENIARAAGFEVISRREHSYGIVTSYHLRRPIDDLEEEEVLSGE